jgi:hypothetical protein
MTNKISADPNHICRSNSEVSRRPGVVLLLENGTNIGRK